MLLDSNRAADQREPGDRNATQIIERHAGNAGLGARHFEIAYLISFFTARLDAE